MTDRLTWFELSALQPGAVVAFGCEFHHSICYQPHVVPVGTVCTITDNGLNEIWGGLLVRPLDVELAKTLVYAHTDHHGLIYVGDTPDPGGHGDDADPRWGALSPFMLHEQVECI